MFTCIRNGVTLTILLHISSLSYGQTTVWLSDNATFADLDLTTAAAPGTTGAFDIWIKTEHSDRLVGVGLDLMAVGEAIEFTGADIVIGRDRFIFHGNPTVMHDGAMITNLWTFTGLGGGSPGIGPGVPVDNEDLGAYRFATVHYRIAELGVSDLQLRVGEFLFLWTDGGPNTVHLGINDPMSQNIPGGTDGIIDGRIRVVPEPSSLVSLIGALCLSLKRAGR
jgi:hypothetical protein